MKKTDNVLEQYRRQLNEWVAALAVADNEAVVGLAAGYDANDVHLFTEGNLGKREDILRLQLSFLRPVFGDLDDLIGEYVETNAQLAFTAGPADAAAFLAWLNETVELTPEQGDHVVCRQTRYAVEDAARANRAAHVRFSERLSVAPLLAKSLARNGRLRVSLNPTRAWATLHTRELLDEQTALPGRVIFFAVRTTIRSAVLDEPMPALLEALGDESLTLAEWAARAGFTAGELLPVTQRLAELGLVALS